MLPRSCLSNVQLRVGGSYNGYISSPDDPPSIGVSSRSLNARDIKRHFLPKLHEVVVERKRQHEEYVVNQQ